jgi:hypothetical protein
VIYRPTNSRNVFPVVRTRATNQIQRPYNRVNTTWLKFILSFVDVWIVEKLKCGLSGWMNQYMVNYRFLVLSMRAAMTYHSREHMKYIGRCFHVYRTFGIIGSPYRHSARRCGTRTVMSLACSNYRNGMSGYVWST